MTTPEAELEKIMKRFCDIVMPGHNKKRGYINVRKKVEALGVDPRTYYHWKKRQYIPRLKDLIARLHDKGFILEIRPLYEDIDS